MESEIVPLQHADGAKSPTHWQSLKATGAKLELAIEVVRFLRSNTLMIIVVVVVLSAGLIKLPDLIKMFHPFSTEAMGATEAVPTTPATPKVAPAPAKASYRLFEEYPLVQTDMNALTPQERARSILVSLRHLSPRERTAWSVRWTASPEAREIAPGSGIYRIPCSGAVAGEFLKLMKDYPYAVAPGSRTDPAYAASYRSVTEMAGFAVPVVVRGDWLFVAGLDSPRFALHCLLAAEPAEVEGWQSEPLDAEWMFGEDPERGRSLMAGRPTRPGLETKTGMGSPFVRWAQGAGLAVSRN